MGPPIAMRKIANICTFKEMIMMEILQWGKVLGGILRDIYTD